MYRAPGIAMIVVVLAGIALLYIGMQPYEVTIGAIVSGEKGVFEAPPRLYHKVTFISTANGSISSITIVGPVQRIEAVCKPGLCDYAIIRSYGTNWYLLAVILACILLYAAVYLLIVRKRIKGVNTLITMLLGVSLIAAMTVAAIASYISTIPYSVVEETHGKLALEKPTGLIVLPNGKEYRVYSFKYFMDCRRVIAIKSNTSGFIVIASVGNHTYTDGYTPSRIHVIVFNSSTIGYNATITILVPREASIKELYYSEISVRETGAYMLATLYKILYAIPPSIILAATAVFILATRRRSPA